MKKFSLSPGVVFVVIVVVFTGITYGVTIGTHSRVSWYENTTDQQDNDHLFWTRLNNGPYGRDTRLGPIDILTPAGSDLAFPLFNKW